MTGNQVEMAADTALRRWREQVVTCRQERGEAEEATWQRTAPRYEGWVQNNDYVELTLPHLLPLLGSDARVLEIGPGSGAFTVPLARAAREVVAVEPSASMREILARNLTQAGVQNVRVAPRPIQEVAGALEGPFELAFASYSLYNVEPIDRVLRGLLRAARHVIVLMSAGEGRPWYRELYRRFKGKDPVPAPRLQHYYPVLLEMGIYADVRVYRVSDNDVHDSEAALIERWQRKLGVGDAQRDALRAALLPLTEHRGSQVGIYNWSRATLVWIERGRSW